MQPWLAPWFARPKAWQILDIFIGLTMWVLAVLTKHAETLGLNMTRFHAEMADRIYTQRVQEHRRAAQLNDLHTTPTFIFNGKRVDTSAGFDKLEAAARALKR